jgi:hypothetical protein
MRLSSLVLAGALVLVATAASADDPMATTYGNTVVTKNLKTGAAGQLLFNADGTYTAKGTDAGGKPIAYPGKWVEKNNGATLCLTPQLPANTPNPPSQSCSPLSVHPIGQHWTVTNSMGDSFDVVVNSGR